MNKTVFRVVGLDQATCGDAYVGAETASQPASMEMLKIYNPGREASLSSQKTAAKVTVRLRDIIQVLQQSSADRLAWINDFADDPMVITQDLYDVILTYQRMKRAG